MILNYYFNTWLIDDAKEIQDIKDFKFNDNELTCNVEGYNLHILFNDWYMDIKCDCGKENCEHAYIALLTREYELAKTEKKVLDNLVRNRGKLLNTKDSRFLDKEAYIKYLNELSSVNIDTLINTEETDYINTFLREMNYFFDNNLDMVLDSFDFDFEFKCMRIIYEYFMNLDFLNVSSKYDRNYRLIMDLKRFLKKSLRSIVPSSKKSDDAHMLFDWLESYLTLPPYNDLTLYLRTLANSNFKLNEYLLRKEEISLHMFNKSDDEEYFTYNHLGEGKSKVEKLDTDYYRMFRNTFPLEHKEKEFWFNYHYSTLKSLKYSDEEIISFLEYAKPYPLAQDELIKYYPKNHKTDNAIDLIKSELLNKDLDRFDYAKLIRKLKFDAPYFLNTEDYTKLLEKLVFEKKYGEYAEEYIKRVPNWKDRKDELIPILKNDKFHVHIILNELCFENNDMQGLLRNLKKCANIKEYLKYEEYIIDDYPDDACDALMESLKNMNLNASDDKILKYIDLLCKYPNWRENVKTLKRYYRANYTNVYPVIRTINKHYNKDKKLV